LTQLSYAGRVTTGQVYQQENPHRRGRSNPALAADRHPVGQADAGWRNRSGVVDERLGCRCVDLAQLYLERWSIESLFNVLTMTLKCEQECLGYPKAALFAFCVTLVAYNVLAR